MRLADRLDLPFPVLSDPDKLAARAFADPSGPATLARESGGLDAAAREHPRAVQRLLVLDRDALVRVSDSSVHVQPAYEWLLSNPEER